MSRRLVKGVGAGAPVGEEYAEADSLEDAGNGTNGNGVDGALLRDNLRDNLACSVSFHLLGQSFQARAHVPKEQQKQRR